MDAKEKAKELIDKFVKYADGVYLRADDRFIYSPEVHHKNAKQCALIAVDEIIKRYQLNISLGWLGAIHESNIEYFQKVKEEINQQ